MKGMFHDVMIGGMPRTVFDLLGPPTRTVHHVRALLSTMRHPGAGLMVLRQRQGWQ